LRRAPRLEQLEGRLLLAQFIVTSGGDDGQPGTLRIAIQNANATPGPDQIIFQIGSGGPVSIPVQGSPMPAITDPVMIDGTTQPGFTGTPLIQLDGTLLGLGSGLEIAAGGDGTQIISLAVTRMPQSGIFINTSGDNQLIGNYVGVDPTGGANAGNAGGGIVLLNAPNNTIGGTTAAERNILSNNAGFNGGLLISGPSSVGNLVIGNFIGTDATGVTALPNQIGLIVSDASQTTIGGTAAGAGNVIAGNTTDGIQLFGDTGTVIQGNLIGTNVTQNVDLPNGGNGIIGQGTTGALIGGATLEARNIITASGASGIHLESSSDGNTIQGNLIGQNPDGNSGGNTQDGITLLNSSNNTIGGPTATTGTAPGNVISSNAGAGVQIVGDANTPANSNVIQGNLIGTSADGLAASGNQGTGIILDGSAADNSIGGDVSGAGNAIAANGLDGIFLSAAGVTRTVIQGNLIGLGLSNVTGLGNTGNGINILGSPANTVGGTAATARNVISDNDQDGILVLGGAATGNVILGNFIGTDITGNSDIGNLANGINLDGAPSNTIGGAAAGAGNVITANNFSGIIIQNAGASANVVQGNLIGQNPTLTSNGNSSSGVTIFQTGSNTIGGVTSQPGTGAGNVIFDNGASGVEIQGIASAPSASNVVQGNVISGNTLSGVSIFNAGATNNLVAGNFIGTNLAGAAALPNDQQGVLVALGAGSNTIGGTTPDARNVVSGNSGAGIIVSGTGTDNVVIQGNLIGTAADGVTALGNAQNGILVADGPTSLAIGGTVTGAANTIAFNTGAGVAVPTSVGVGDPQTIQITGNSIYSNTGLGIDLGPAGVTPNDVTDPDPGPNLLQNFPILTRAEFVGTTLIVEGTLNSIPGELYVIEVFADQGDPTGFGEGQFFLGRTSVATDPSTGDATFSLQVTLASLPAPVVSATASRIVGASLETGEFSADLAVAALDFTVRNTNDAGQGSLRQAILNANLVPGVQTIDFAIPGVGPFTIEPLTALPSITDPVIVDAYTQDGSSPNTNGIGLAGNAVLLVELSGVSVPSFPGLVIATSDTTIRGLVINRFDDGILISGDGTNRNIIAGNYIGTNTAGTAALGNELGVRVRGAANNNIIGGADPTARNVISGNAVDGVLIQGFGTNNNQVIGNYIGTNAAGTDAVGNGGVGVGLGSGVDPDQFGSSNNQIIANVISGNGIGIGIGGTGTGGNIVQANRIGTNAAGADGLGNLGDGVLIQGGASSNTVGGTAEVFRNIIAGNEASGIRIAGASTTSNLIVGNFIGTNIRGDAGIPNLEDGISLEGAPENVIGVPGLIPSNLISANRDSGIRITGSADTEVVGNFIGTDLAGARAIGLQTNGIFVDGSENNIIGGTTADERNVVSGNTEVNIQIFGAGATGNSVLGNFIGTDASGTRVVRPPGETETTVGIFVNDAPNNLIGGSDAGAANVVAGATVGVELFQPGASGNQVFGNRLGTDLAGTERLPNDIGLLAFNAPGNLLGGTAPGQANIISGNRTIGARISGSSAVGNVLSGNRIGTDPSGTIGVFNGFDGVFLDAPGNLVSENVISGNGSVGVQIFSSVAAGNRIIGNLIGTDVSGTAALGNRLDGVFVNEAPNNQILNNLISANGSTGLQLFGTGAAGNTVQGNRIGTNISGAVVPGLGNAFGLFLNTRSANTIGGTGPGQENIIAGNTRSNSVQSPLLLAPGIQGLALTTSGTQITAIQITFTKDMDAASVQRLSNYRLQRVARANAAGGRAIRIASVSYDALSRTVTLVPGAVISADQSLRLTVIGRTRQGVKDTEGRFLDGNADRRSGDNFVTVLGNRGRSGTRARAVRAEGIDALFQASSHKPHPRRFVGIWKRR
jgi:hypothetical protein